MVAVERKAPSSPVLCLLSSVVCQITAPATLNFELQTLNSEPISNPHLSIGNICIGNTFTLATLPLTQRPPSGNCYL